jgi:4-amino-4-deoxy-L-arabinose transferase-like glycosyltransferase
VPNRLHQLWWAALAALWLLATGADRLWLAADQRLPAWDQADYLNSAVDHGRALGWLAGGAGWQGWDALLDLSPKIPPLSSLVSAAVMHLAGDSADGASWVLSLWHGLLLLVVACWGRQLVSAGFGLLAAATVALAPALLELRTDFTLDLPLTASSLLALWLLGRWQQHDASGGRWGQAVLAAGALAAAVMVKQSALLVLAPPALWAATRSLSHPRRRWQALTALALVLALALPWLHHNWITTLGGTERAVVTSGAAEGDPGSLDARSLIWYPRLWPQQLGSVPLAIGLLGLALLGWDHHHRCRLLWRRPLQLLPSGWPWLIGCCLSGWLFTSLSPNKDPRYIAPVLPLLLMLLARGWWSIGTAVQRRLNGAWAGALLAGGLLAAVGQSAGARFAAIQNRPGSPAAAVIERLRLSVGQRPTLLALAASSPELNEQTLTYLGRRQGGQILARRLGGNEEEHDLALAHSDWWVLATRDQGTKRLPARILSQRVRRDGRFVLVQRWPWSKKRSVELWRRKATAAAPGTFDREFIAMAHALPEGPRALAPLFQRIGPWHLLDPTFSYQGRVGAEARARLQHHPTDHDALWSLALIAVLQNRPHQADQWFARLEQLDGRGSWATAYRGAVLLADWNTCGAARVSDVAPAVATPDAAGAAAVLQSLRDLGRSLCFDPRGPIGLSRSLPQAIGRLNSL